MCRFKLYFLIFTVCFHYSRAQISDKRFCIDSECNSPVSRGKTLLPYYAPEKHHLSFDKNERVTIYSKSAGSNMRLWGAEINGKRGYIPKDFVKETEIIGKPTLLVDTELGRVSNSPQVPMENDVRPSKVKEMYEVIDGTTIYNGYNEEEQEAERKIEDQTVQNERTEEMQSKESMENDSGENEGGNGLIGDLLNNVINFLDTDQKPTEANSGENIKIDVEELKPTLNDQKIESDPNIPVLSEFHSEHQSNKIPIVEEITQQKTPKTDVDLIPEESIVSAGQIEAEPDNVPQFEMSENLNQSDNAVVEKADSDRESEMKPDDIPNSEKPGIDEMSFHQSNIDEMKGEEMESAEQIEVEPDNNPHFEVHASEENFNETRNEEIASQIEVKPEKEIIDDAKTDNEQTILTNSETQDLNLDSINMESVHLEEPVFEKNLVDEKTEHVPTLSEDQPFPIQDKNELQNQENVGMKSEETPSTSDIQNQKELTDNIETNTETNSMNEVNNTESLEEINSSMPTETVPQSSFYKNPEFVTLPYPNLIDNENPIPFNDENQIETDHNQTHENSEVHSDSAEVGTTGEDSPSNNSEKTDASQESSQNQEQHTVEQNKGFYDTSDFMNIREQNSSPITESVSQTQEVNDHVVTKNEWNGNKDEKHVQTIPDEVQSNTHFEKNDEPIVEESPNIFSYLGSSSFVHKEEEKPSNEFPIQNQEYKDYFCTKTENWLQMVPDFGSDLSLYLLTTAISVITFLLGYFALNKNKREGPLIAKINKLEHEYLILLKEKELLVEKIENGSSQENIINTQEFSNLKMAYDNVILEKQGMEDQIQTLEKELENSTEVGLELNRMLSELLSSENAGETLMSNIEGLQAQLAEQQDIVKDMKETLSLKETENHELNLELDISNKKVIELQTELDKLLLNILRIEEEKEAQEKNYQCTINKLQEDVQSLNVELEKKQEDFERKLSDLTDELTTSNRNLQLKIKEYEGLKNTMLQLKETKNENILESLMEVNSIRAELDQLKVEYQTNSENLKREKETSSILEKRVKSNQIEMDKMKEKYDQVDKSRLELDTKLQVLTTYFKDRETQLQKELSKYESMWSAKQGEATSTSEKIKYLQSEVQNYKSQNELLKQEIVSQEVELKSQISVLEKKVHENWVSARQAERRLEDLKQEAAQLRNRLTLRERALQENKARVQSPLEQNGDLPISPLHIENPSSPPLLFSSRDHITKSPSMLGMPPPPFLPPPPGAPFLPPHLPFMPPPPPDMFPGDHRPPPLGRMSSPPLNSRYSPDLRSYSTYDRRSPSPSYDESEYGTSPVHHRRYSPFNSRRDHRRKLNGRNGAMSSGSGNSNESLDDLNNSNV